MKKSKLLTSLFIIIILLSSMVIAKFFIGNNQLFAQQMDPDNPSTWPDINVYLYYPPPEQNPIIYGQTDLIFNFTGIDPVIFGNHVTDFSIEVYDDSNADAANLVGSMNIINHFQQRNKNGEFNTFWTFSVDTMDFENFDNYYFRIRTFVGTYEVPLIYSSENCNNCFGPMTIQNNPEIIHPSHNYVIESNVDITSRLDGMAQGVLYNILDSSGDVVDSITAGTPENSGYEFTYWTANWDTNNVADGQYVLTLSFITIEGNLRSDVYEMMVLNCYF